MYTLVAVLSLVATAAFVRRRPVVLVARADAPALHAHLGCLPVRRPSRLVWLVRDRGREGLLVGAAVAVLYLPWAPSLVFQALHTGAPWSLRPSVLCTSCPRRSPSRGGRATSSLSRAPRASPWHGSHRSSSRRGRRGTCSCSSGRCWWCWPGGRRGSWPSRSSWRRCSWAARHQEQRPGGRRQRRRHAARGRSRRLHAAGAGPGPAPVSPARRRIPDAARHARGRIVHRLARRRPARARRRTAQGHADPRLHKLAPGSDGGARTPAAAAALAVEPRGAAPHARVARALHADPRLRSLGRHVAARPGALPQRGASRALRGLTLRRVSEAAAPPPNGSSPTVSRTLAARAGRSPSAPASRSARSRTT